MIAEELQNQRVDSLVYLGVRSKQIEITLDYRCQHQMRNTREYRVVIVLANSEVHIAAVQNVGEQVAELLQVIPFLSVCVLLDWLFVEAVPESQQLDNILGCFFEDDQAIDTPCVEPETITSVKYEFREELEHADYYFIVIMECIQCGLYNGA